LILDGSKGRTQPAVGSHFGARPSSQRRQRKWSSPRTRKTTPLTWGCGPRALSIEDPQDRPAPAFRTLTHAEREARRPKLERRRQAPHDSSCSPEPPCDVPQRRPPGSVERAAAAQAGRASPRASNDSVGARATRVGCRSRSGASSPVSCGGEGGGRGRKPTDADGTLETRGSMRWALAPSDDGERTLSHAKGCRSARTRVLNHTLSSSSAAARSWPIRRKALRAAPASRSKPAWRTDDPGAAVSPRWNTGREPDDPRGHPVQDGDPRRRGRGATGSVRGHGWWVWLPQPIRRRGSVATAAGEPKRPSRSEPHPPACPKLSRRKTATLCDGIRGANRRVRRVEPTAHDDVRSALSYVGARSEWLATVERPRRKRVPEASGEPSGTIL